MVGKERAGGCLGDPSTRLVFVERALKRAPEHVVLRAVVEDHAEPGILVAILLCEHFPHFCDIGFLTADDEEPARGNLRLSLEGPRFANASVEFSLKLIEEGPEGLEVIARPLGSDFFRGPLLSARAHVVKFGDTRCHGLDAKLRQQCVVIHSVRKRLCHSGATTQQPLPIQRREERPAFVLLEDPVQPHGIESFEDIAVLAPLGSATVHIHKPLDLLEARDDPFFTGRVPGNLFGFDLDTELVQQGSVLLGEPLRHRSPPPSCWPERPRLPPCASPRDRVR